MISQAHTQLLMSAFGFAANLAGQQVADEANRREMELAAGTAEGNALAANLSKEQLLDAGAHGADQSPDFQATLDRLDAADTRLDQAMKSAQPAVAAANTFPNADVLAALQAAGVVLADQSQGGHGITFDGAQTIAVGLV